MYKQRIALFIFFLSFCITKTLFSQIVSGTPSVGGCAPANFTYTAPNGSTGHSWNFGDGSGITTLASGSHNYTSPGTYICTYAGSLGNFTVVVNVYAKPVPAFAISQTPNNCVIKTVTLTNQSTASSPISSWQWTYGDGGSATFANGNPHTYGYTLPGTYSVSLKVIDINGCDNQITVGTVSVFATPNAIISSNPTNLSACFPPFSPSFASGVAAPNGATYAWNFGNNQTSTSANPGTITYTAAGSYNVSFTITANGCSSVDTRVVTINSPTLIASAPSTICLNAPFTVTVQSNQNFTNWNMGGGIFAAVPTSTNPTTYTIGTSFASSGPKTITVTAGSSPCITTSLISVNVQQVIANFTAAPPYNSCSSPLIVNYQSTSSPDATQFSWSYTTTQNQTVTATGSPYTFTFTQGSNNPYSNFNSIYNYSFAPSVTLIATSPAGCTGSVVNVFHMINKPAASFYKDKQNGCVPLAVTYSNNSFVFPSNPITSYTWCNGATPNLFVTGTGSNIPAQVFTYTSTGTYTPYLIIQTAGGCTATSFVDTVRVAAPPVISFSASPAVVCWDQPVQIVNTTAPAVISQIKHWHVESGNGFFSGCIGDPNPSWKFTRVGVHGFTMSAYVNGCKGTAQFQNVTVNGPIVSARYETNCTNRYSVDFSCNLQAVTNFTLDFGDASPKRIVSGNTAVSDFTTHVYAASGDYVATLSGLNSITGCPLSTYTMLVTVRNARAIFSTPVPSVACLGASVTLNAAASLDVFGVCSRGYVWYVDNLPPIDKTVPSFTTQFFSAGTHTVKVAVKDINSCMSETITTIRISSVTPAFSFASPSVCVNGTVQLINTSTSSSPDPITACRWTFEQGQTLSTNGITSPTYTYTNATPPSSLVTSVLSVTNSLGCVGSVLNTILVISPSAAFVASQYNFCIGANPFPITFNALGANASYTYNYGTAPPTTSVTTGSTSTFSYSQAGTYNVTLRVRDFSGCENSSGPLMLFAEKTPTANFTFSSPKSTGGNVICSPAQVSFTATSGQGSSPIVNYNWNLGSGAPVVSQSIVTFPYNNANNANIVVSLTVQTAFGCASSQTKNFTIYTPKADILANKTTVCLGDAITFNIKDTTGRGIFAWNWDFGNNNTTATVIANSSPPSSTVQPFTIFNAPSGWVDVNLIYYSSQYACKDFAKLSIRVIKTIADFKRNAELVPSDSVHCLRRLDNFVNTSPMLSGYSLNWNFGNGVTSSALNPAYVYPQSGIYQVSLTVTGEQNCKGLAVKNMTINPLPTAKIISRDSICKRTLFDLTGVGISTVGITGYTWSPASNFVNPFASPASGSLAATGNFSLIVSDANGCVSDATVKSIYIYDPKADIAASKTTVCIGDAITFNIKDTTGRGIFAWSWDFGNNNTASTVIANSSPPSSTLQPFTVFNTPNGIATVRLIYYSKQFSCKDSAKLNIRVIKTFVDFKRNAELQQSDSVHCVRVQDVFANTSPASAGYPVNWNFGNGATSAAQSPTYTFLQSGIYPVSLTVTGEQNCRGLAVKNMTINPLPRANIVSRDSICKDALFTLTGVGTSTVGITGYTWSPVAAFVNPYTSPASGSLTASGSFSLIVGDANGCVSDPTVRSIYIQQPEPFREWDTTVIVGQPIPINAFVGNNFSYTWSPVSDLTCNFCFFPVSSSTVNVTYSVEVQDNLGCFRVTNTYTVYIDPQTSVDVPTAFTPNGDGTNDVIYVDGWGIKKLNFFRIFNRWGQLIFESNDVNVGWDGTYNGVPQNTETYIYQVSVKTYTNEKDLTKTSSFRLIR